MSRLLALIAATLSLALPSVSADKLRDKIESYKNIEIGPIRNKVGDVLDQKTIEELQERLVASINASKLLAASQNGELKFPKKDSDDDTKLVFDGTSRDEDKATLILFCELITFNKGSRTKRYLLGGGTGRAELRGNCYLIDRNSGKQLYNFQSFGETNWGLFGGGSDKTLKGFANRVIGFLKGKY